MTPLRSRHRLRSAATLVWLLALLVVGVTQVRGTWPVSRSTMFAFDPEVHVALVLEGTRAGGRTQVLPAAGLGLTPGQLRNWLAAELGSQVTPADLPVLATVAEVWNARHPGDAVTAATLAQVTTPLPPADAVPRREELLSWPAP